MAPEGRESPSLSQKLKACWERGGQMHSDETVHRPSRPHTAPLTTLSRGTDGPAGLTCPHSGTYPEYDVESEDEILDAAAHFVSLEMLPRHHLEGLPVRHIYGVPV